MSDRQLIADLLSALEYHTEQTRPIEFSRVAIEAAREYLRKPARQEPIGYTDGINWQPRQSEMVVKIVRNKQPEHGFVHDIYTSPQSKPWVGLDASDYCGQSEEWCDGALAAEAKLKEKNT